MFYSQDILQKRGGKFGKIWLAATKIVKLTRREVASVNVVRSCDEILEHIELRGHPRLSLYLSALLMYGVVRIHHKHCEYLLNDVSAVFVRFKSAPFHETNIDLQESARADQVTNPDFVTMTRDVPSDIHDLLMSEMDLGPMSFMQLKSLEFWGVSTLESPSEEKSRKKRKSDHGSRAADTLSVASMDQITLKEPPTLLVDTPLSPILVPSDMDLPMLDQQQLAQLLAGQNEEPEPPLQVSDLLSKTTRPDTGKTLRPKRHIAMTASESPVTVRQEDKEKTPDRRHPSLEVPEPRALPLSPGVTQPIITSPLIRRPSTRASLELELTDVTPATSRKRRKRQLAFADMNTQISKIMCKESMITGQDTCSSFKLPDPLATDLFNVPGRQALRELLWCKLWARNACIPRGLPETQLAEAHSPEEELNIQMQSPILQQPSIQVDKFPKVSEKDISTIPQVLPSLKGPHKRSTLEESLEEMRRTASMSLGPQGYADLSSLEMQRDSSSSQIDKLTRSLDESFVLDDSQLLKKDKSITKSRRNRSSVLEEAVLPHIVQDVPQASVAASQTSASRLLYDLLEEPRFEEQFIAIPLMQEQSMEHETVHAEFLRVIKEEIDHESGSTTTFHDICNPSWINRVEAVGYFAALLDLCAQGKIKATQKTSYGDIILQLPM